MNLNKVFLIGRMTADPVLKASQGGQNVCGFSLATNRTWKDKNGAKQEKVEFHNCVAWGKTAELIAQYVHKGGELFVEGRLQTRDWEDKQKIKRRTTEIVVESMQLGAKPQGARIDDVPPPPSEDVQIEEPFNVIKDEKAVDDIPF